MLSICFYLKLILRLSTFRIIVTDTKLKKKKTSLKKIQNNSTMYFIHHSLPLSRHAMLETKNGWEGDNNLLSPFFNLTTLKIM